MTAYLGGELRMFLTSTVGRKITMAITGQMMILFVIGHVLGNSTIYFRTLNAYAAALHNLPVLLWVVRLFMFSMLCLHVWRNRRPTPSRTT